MFDSFDYEEGSDGTAQAWVRTCPHSNITYDPQYRAILRGVPHELLVYFMWMQGWAAINPRSFTCTARGVPAEHRPHLGDDWRWSWDESRELWDVYTHNGDGCLEWYNTRVSGDNVPLEVVFAAMRANSVLPRVPTPRGALDLPWLGTDKGHRPYTWYLRQLGPGLTSWVWTINRPGAGPLMLEQSTSESLDYNVPLAASQDSWLARAVFYANGLGPHPGPRGAPDE